MDASFSYDALIITSLKNKKLSLAEMKYFSHFVNSVDEMPAMVGRWRWWYVLTFDARWEVMGGGEVMSEIEFDYIIICAFIMSCFTLIKLEIDLKSSAKCGRKLADSAVEFVFPPITRFCWYYTLPQRECTHCEAAGIYIFVRIEWHTMKKSKKVPEVVEEDEEMEETVEGEQIWKIKIDYSY